MQTEVLANVRPGKKANLVECRFGKLVVVSYAGQKRYGPRNSACLWLCRCDCGKEVNATTGELNFGSRWHCGCSSYPVGPESRNWAGYGGIPGRFWFQVEKNAKDRGLVFDITGEQAWEIFQKQRGKCALTGVELKFRSRLSTASLDRIDSSKGYTIDNVWWLHKLVNRMKWTLSVDDFIGWSKLIVEHAKQYEHRTVVKV